MNNSFGIRCLNVALERLLSSYRFLTSNAKEAVGLIQRSESQDETTDDAVRLQESLFKLNNAQILKIRKTTVRG
ncbi:hypothetical protein VNO80_28109 [Phaseolus coccineus]|uniref:Uncharacterized protein n=1 Tax=Phaseolus coccineus TaxID=3886 RepID=A0AAN9LH76_PHACN